MLEAAADKAAAANVKVAIVILDARGDLKAAVRLDGAQWRAVPIAQGKAFAAAIHDLPSRDLAARADSAIKRALMIREGGNIIPTQGALPIRLDGEPAGAIGVSGAPTSQLDEDIAAAGIAALGSGVEGGER
jgi:uncharacterized protein GlcG (DUF336 family)